MIVTYQGATEPTREIMHHHAVLRRRLEQRVDVLWAAAGHGTLYDQALAALRTYLAKEILPHAQAEEQTLYQAAITNARGSQLVRTLTLEHRELARLADWLQSPGREDMATTVAEWIATLFAGHVAKENDLLLPALTDSGADLAALLADMHQILADMHRMPAGVAA
jgi:predicted NAD/FAD-binding protein